MEQVLCKNKTRNQPLLSSYYISYLSKAANSRAIVDVPGSSELAVDVHVDSGGVVFNHLGDTGVRPPTVLQLTNGTENIQQHRNGIRHIDNKKQFWDWAWALTIQWWASLSRGKTMCYLLYCDRIHDFHTFSTPRLISPQGRNGRVKYSVGNDIHHSSPDIYKALGAVQLLQKHDPGLASPTKPAHTMGGRGKKLVR